MTTAPRYMSLETCMKHAVTMTAEDKLLRLSITFQTADDATKMYENLVAAFKAGKDTTLELNNPEPTQ